MYATGRNQQVIAAQPTDTRKLRFMRGGRSSLVRLQHGQPRVLLCALS